MISLSLSLKQFWAIFSSSFVLLSQTASVHGRRADGGHYVMVTMLWSPCHGHHAMATTLLQRMTSRYDGIVVKLAIDSQEILIVRQSGNLPLISSV